MIDVLVTRIINTCTFYIVHIFMYLLSAQTQLNVKKIK